MTTAAACLTLGALALAMLGTGFVVGHLTAPSPISTVVYEPLPSGEYLDAPVRIYTGDGSGFEYVCDIYLTPDAQGDVADCRWPSAEDAAASTSP